MSVMSWVSLIDRLTLVVECFSGGTSSDAFARSGKRCAPADAGDSAKELSPGSILPAAVPENLKDSP